MIVVLIAVACFGLAYVVGHSEISYGIRHWAFWFRFWNGRCDHCNARPFGYTTSKSDTPEIECMICKGKISSIVETAAPFRFLVNLIECPACFGWWTGLGLGIAIVLGEPRVLLPILEQFPPLWLAPLYVAFAVSGSNFLLASIVGMMPRKHPPIVQILEILGNGEPRWSNHPPPIVFPINPPKKEEE